MTQYLTSIERRDALNAPWEWDGADLKGADGEDLFVGFNDDYPEEPARSIIQAAPLLLEALEAVHAWGDLDGDLRQTVEKALKEAGSLVD